TVPVRTAMETWRTPTAPSNTAGLIDYGVFCRLRLDRGLFCWSGCGLLLLRQQPFYDGLRNRLADLRQRHVGIVGGLHGSNPLFDCGHRARGIRQLERVRGARAPNVDDAGEVVIVLGILQESERFCGVDAALR